MGHVVLVTAIIKKGPGLGGWNETGTLCPPGALGDAPVGLARLDQEKLSATNRCESPRRTSNSARLSDFASFNAVTASFADVTFLWFT